MSIWKSRKDVIIQDQATRPFSFRLNKYIQTGLTLAVDTIVNSKTIQLSSGHGLIGGESLLFIEENGAPNFFFSEVISVVGDVITLATIMPHAFSADKTAVIQYDVELNKNGSSSVYIAELRNPYAIPVDITRLLFHMTDSTPMDDALFGGGAALINGISLRKQMSDDEYWHLWNVKTNGDFGELAYDKQYDTKAPAGVYGMTVRLSYSGLDKHGVVIKLRTNEALQLLVQDDLTGLLSFTITVQGHFAEGEG